MYLYIYVYNMYIYIYIHIHIDMYVYIYLCVYGSFSFVGSKAHKKEPALFPHSMKRPFRAAHDVATPAET